MQKYPATLSPRLQRSRRPLSQSLVAAASSPAPLSAQADTKAVSSHSSKFFGSAAEASVTTQAPALPDYVESPAVAASFIAQAPAEDNKKSKVQLCRQFLRVA